ncbi:MAG: trehalase family glycosidase [Bacteroidota bacterium]
MNQLLRQAQQILSDNWRGGFTIPTNRLYPFQWNWDSGFVSIGWGHIDLQRAIQELESLFNGQWANGMIPHIIFHSETEDSYFPNFDFWDSAVNAGAPQKPKTSGITQPPVHGFVLERLLAQHPDDPRLQAFAKAIYPKIVHSHRFFYQYRDPHQEGLAFIFHPWESGRDNSALWDDILRSIVVDSEKLPSYTRKDLQHADAAQRPTQAEYDRFVYLLDLGKRHRYDGPGIHEESPFLVQDSLINAILIRSNEALIQIGKRFKLDTAELEEWQTQSLASYRSKLWQEDLGFYASYDMRADQAIPHREVGALVALFAGIPERGFAERLESYLKDLHQRGYYLCPSFDVDSPRFDSKRYWRGPIWPQMNWLLYQGLKRYGFEETAGLVRQDLIDLISQLGFYEYFEAQKSLVSKLEKGYGGGNFSWAASSYLDLILAP